MNIIALNATLPAFQPKLAQLNKMIFGVMQELGMEVKEFNLTPQPDLQELPAIFEAANNASGIIINATVTACSLSAPMMYFFEQLAVNPQAGQYLAGKNCMLVILTTDGGGLQALNFYSSAINYLSAFAPVAVCVDASHFEGNELKEDVREIIEKQVEDYYRMIRQGRQFLIPVESDKTRRGPSGGTGIGTPTNQASKLYQKLNLEQFTERQEKDIDEITQFLSKKYAGKLESAQEPTAQPAAPAPTDFILPEFTPPAEAVPLPAPVPPAAPPRPKTCFERTKALPNYFQRGGSTSANHTVQLNISGSAESFQGYIVIDGSECHYNDGKADNPDITIIADEDVWDNVLQGKTTAQKAFMVGQLKVRGNFVLLTKFESLFAPIL